MTPQQLIDLRGYGSAEKALRRAGLWRLTPFEKLQASIDGLSDAIDSASNYISDIDHIFTEEENQ